MLVLYKIWQHVAYGCYISMNGVFSPLYCIFHQLLHVQHSCSSTLEKHMALLHG